MGSRVTCSPPPTDTDEDYLLLVSDAFTACKNLKGIGFEGETDLKKIEEYIEMNNGSLSSFQSLRFGDINYIVTDSPFLFERFLTATHIAKELNLLSKADRVMLFSAIRGKSFAELVCPEMGRVWDGVREQAIELGKAEVCFEASLAQVVNFANTDNSPF